MQDPTPILPINPGCLTRLGRRRIAVILFSDISILFRTETPNSTITMTKEVWWVESNTSATSTVTMAI